MIPIGYMYKTVSKNPEWLKTDGVIDIYSVSGCISEDFTDWTEYWKHNKYWLFDNPQIIQELAKEHNLSLDGMKLFFYSAYEKQWNIKLKVWEDFSPEETFETKVTTPLNMKSEGFDAVTYFCRNSAECSPLSCNSMAEKLKTNIHCLFNSFEDAYADIENGSFDHCEPGPYRILEVFSVELWMKNSQSIQTS